MREKFAELEDTISLFKRTSQEALKILPSDRGKPSMDRIRRVVQVMEAEWVDSLLRAEVRERATMLLTKEAAVEELYHAIQQFLADDHRTWQSVGGRS